MNKKSKTTAYGGFRLEMSTPNKEAHWINSPLFDFDLT